jgi:hypothetical protein
MAGNGFACVGHSGWKNIPKKERPTQVVSECGKSKGKT